MFRTIVSIALVSSAIAFSPSRMMTSRRVELSMSADNKFSKALAIAAMGVSLFAPIAPAMADGAVSASTVFRARNSYGQRILGLESAANSGNFAAFEDAKAKNGFDLFISGSNRSPLSKALKASETKIKADIYAAVQAKDAGKLKSSYSEFIKAADLKSDFKAGDLGQTDSSGYSPTWGTSKQYIYQR